MPQSLSVVYLHLVFSTKDRRPFLREARIRPALHAYLGEISKRLDCPSRSPRRVDWGACGGASRDWMRQTRQAKAARTA